MSKNVSSGGAVHVARPSEYPGEDVREQRKRIVTQRLRGMMERLALEEYHKISLLMAIAIIEGTDPLFVAGVVD